eukprot:COSAG04_NODE_56_length_30604_cov_692.571119_43_plen_66_part_00
MDLRERIGFRTLRVGWTSFHIKFPKGAEKHKSPISEGNERGLVYAGGERTIAVDLLEQLRDLVAR